ncbi:MAG: circadian clock protein KaiB [Proteobacteria bacterium]|nr:MAG: circadian clock protein KaiB [Pseudomonadota bacterium]
MSAASLSASNGHPSLRLYIAGETPGARRALANRRRLIKALDGALQIEVIDILVRPEEAEQAGILATPTLSDDSIHPPRRLIGDISNLAEVLAYFGYDRKDSTR